MVKGKFDRRINVELMSDIPIDGEGYPLLLTTTNPPYSNVIVNISFTAGVFKFDENKLLKKDVYPSGNVLKNPDDTDRW